MIRGNTKMHAPVRVSVIGANFAGLSAALKLPPAFDVTVFDSKPAFEWLPNIHELVSGVKKPNLLRLPLRERIRAAGHHFVQARVTAIDAAGGRLELESGRTMRFDFCIVAVGGVNNTYGVPGAERNALPFKSADDCTAIHHRLEELANGSGSLRVVVVGGGLEGIETLGEILRGYRDHPGLRIDLVEGSERLLPEGPPAVDQAVRRRVQSMPVVLHTRERVAKVNTRSVVLESGGRIRSDLTIWTGGARPPDLLSNAGLAPSAGRWAPVHSNLVSVDFETGLPRH
jgi:NADH dehydrogenase